MALTLLEAAKAEQGNFTRRAIIETFARENDLLSVLPFRNIPGNSYTYRQEGTLPGIAFRGVNEAYSEAVGVVNPETERLVIAGGDLDVDLFIIQTEGAERREEQEMMKTKALAQEVGHKMIKGDAQTSAKEFDGLQVRLTGSQVISNGATSGGDPLSLLKLDETIDAVDGVTHLLMSKAMARILSAAARNTSVGGHVNFEPDELGRRQMFYNGHPILIADRNADVNNSLAFDEAATGGGSTATSIYVLSIGEGKLQGIQNGEIDVRDLGEQDAKPVRRTRVEWYPGMVLEHPRAVSRLRDISNAAAVA